MEQYNALGFEALHKNQEYFTPDIEDIRVGYEFEELGYVTHNGEIWHKRVVEEHEMLYEGVYPRGAWRVPYLTKEQIEAEGWKPANTGGLEKGCMNGRCAFNKGNYFLIIPSQPNTKLGDRIEVVMADILKDDYHEWTSNGRMYVGQCKSINEFKTLMKWLKI